MFRTELTARMNGCETREGRGGGAKQRHLVMSAERERPIIFIPFRVLVQFVPIPQNAAPTN